MSAKKLSSCFGCIGVSCFSLSILFEIDQCESIRTANRKNRCKKRVSLLTVRPFHCLQEIDICKDQVFYECVTDRLIIVLLPILLSGVVFRYIYNNNNQNRVQPIIKTISKLYYSGGLGLQKSRNVVQCLYVFYSEEK
jgi:hypothetical protein